MSCVHLIIPHVAGVRSVGELPAAEAARAEAGQGSQDRPPDRGGSGPAH